MNTQTTLSKFIFIPFTGLNSAVTATHTLHSFHIDHSKMPSIHSFSTKSGYFANMFKELDSIISPSIYWFEAKNIMLANKISNDLENYRNDPKRAGRVIPAKNSYANTNSKVIYVGKRLGGFRQTDKLSHISGRISIHLGYYGVPTTQGLQLIHWFQDELTLNVIKLPQSAEPYLSIIEKLFALQLNPRCGKH